MIKRYYPEPPPEGIRLGTPEADKLILEYSPLIKFIAYRLAMRLPPSVELDDLISAGVIGLIDAIEKYNPDKDTQFKTYAEIRVRGSMLDELRAQDWVPRSVRQKASTVSAAYARLEQELGRPADDDEVAGALGMEIGEFHEFLKQSAATSFIFLAPLLPPKTSSVNFFLPAFLAIPNDFSISLLTGLPVTSIFSEGKNLIES